MKKILLCLFAVMTFCTSCEDDHADKICKFIENAAEKTEKATSLQEINKISENLFINIGYYTQSMSDEEGKELDNDKEAQAKINQFRDKYIEVRDKRILELTPKSTQKAQKKNEKAVPADSTENK